MRIYISGKITGTTDFEQRFGEAEQRLINQGHEVVNPVNLPHEHDKRWHSYMKECLKYMLDCDAIYMLSNWMQSEGAIIERAIADSLNIRIIHQNFEPWIELVPETVFEQFEDGLVF